jgi:hypothetical protein
MKAFRIGPSSLQKSAKPSKTVRNYLLFRQVLSAYGFVDFADIASKRQAAAAIS